MNQNRTIISSQTVVDCESNEKGRILSIYSNKKDETNGDYNYLVNCVVICCECLGGIIVLSMAVERNLFCSHLNPPPPKKKIPYIISPLRKKCQKDVRLRGSFSGKANLTIPPTLTINFTAFFADLKHL